jgi:hypothetical protein
VLYRRHPGDVGAVPYGVELTSREPQGHSRPTTSPTRELTLGAALRTYQLGPFSPCGAWVSSA